MIDMAPPTVIVAEYIKFQDIDAHICRSIYMDRDCIRCLTRMGFDTSVLIVKKPEKASEMLREFLLRKSLVYLGEENTEDAMASLLDVDFTKNLILDIYTLYSKGDR